MLIFYCTNSYPGSDHFMFQTPEHKVSELAIPLHQPVGFHWIFPDAHPHPRQQHHHGGVEAEADHRKETLYPASCSEKKIIFLIFQTNI